MQIRFTHGTPEGLHLPRYRLLVLGPFDPGHAGASPRNIDPTELSAALATLAPHLTLGVPNLLTDAGSTWWVPLQVREWADFSPTGLRRAIPELAWIHLLRAQVEAVAAGRAPLADLASRLEDYAGVSALAPALALCRQVLATPAATVAPPPAPAPAPPVDGDVDRILDLVELPPGGAPPAPSPGRAAMASAIAALARSARPRPVPALQQALAAIDDLLGRQLATILNDPQWQALEGAWRGLRELLAALDGSGRVEVLFCPANPEDLAADLDRCLAQADAADAPVDLVLLDFTFGHGAPDRARLAALAQTAGRYAVPVLLTLAPDFLADAGDRPLAAEDHPARRLEAPAFIKWQALREMPDCRWLTACFNDYLLRPATAEAPVLWGGAAWLVARRILLAVQRSGWPAPITGAQAGRLEGLSATGDAGPLREPLGNDACLDLANAGILALSSPAAPPADSAWILAAPSLLLVPTLADTAETAARRADASLVLQLLRGRLLRLVRRALAQAEAQGAGVAPTLERLLTDWLVDTGPGALARLRRDAEDPRQAALTVVFGDQIGAGLRVDLALTLD